MTILVTGSSGLIGRRLCTSLKKKGVPVKEFDLCGMDTDYGDITCIENLEKTMPGCTGIVHLAAVSRVVWGQKNPDLCWNTNVSGTDNLLKVASHQTHKPWILFSSSREVYGQASALPVSENAQLLPINIYAKSKAQGETLVLNARQHGLQTAVVRLSNVYGCTKDHADRVVPAFARAAAEGKTMRIEGSDHTFDFTHVDDVVRGLNTLIHKLQSGDRGLPVMHLLTGKPTTLKFLAEQCIRLGQPGACYHETDPRDYDVKSFYGNPLLAQNVLGWKSAITLQAGLKSLITDFMQERALHTNTASQS